MMRLLKILFYEEPRDWLVAILSVLPGRVGIKLRAFWLRFYLRQCGPGLNIKTGANIISPKNISISDQFTANPNFFMNAEENGNIQIGKRVSAGCHVHINAAYNGEILIGNDVMIGPDVIIRASNHVFESTEMPMNRQGHKGGKIVIEDDVWIGANVVICPNVRIRTGTVVAAGSVVTKDTGSYEVIGGVPARAIKKRELKQNTEK